MSARPCLEAGRVEFVLEQEAVLEPEFVPASGSLVRVPEPVAQEQQVELWVELWKKAKSWMVQLGSAEFAHPREQRQTTMPRRSQQMCSSQVA